MLLRDISTNRKKLSVYENPELAESIQNRLKEMADNAVVDFNPEDLEKDYDKYGYFIDDEHVVCECGSQDNIWIEGSVFNCLSCGSNILVFQSKDEMNNLTKKTEDKLKSIYLKE